MKNIKCRVWYEDEMIYSDDYATCEFDFSFDVDGILTFSAWNDEIHELTVDGNNTYAGWDLYMTDIMQYTGLKDRNGKEIYEGDIIETFKCDDLDFRSSVIFKNGAFGYSHSGISFVSFAENYLFHWKDGKSKYIKVIGNIHQDEELKRDTVECKHKGYCKDISANGGYLKCFEKCTYFNSGLF